jgi:hypothetical protein
MPKITKEGLIQITIAELRKSLMESPECFELYRDPDWPTYNHLGIKDNTTVIWKSVIMINGYKHIDPNNSPRTIIVNYCYIRKKISCDIFFREVADLDGAIMADASVEIDYKAPLLNKSYRDFMALRRALIKVLKEKDAVDYLKKISSIFPSVVDDELLN